MGKRIEVKKRYGRLVVLGEAPKKNNRRQVVCECDCGKTKTIFLQNLTRGNTKSCGCLSTERLVKHNTTHGHTNSSLYRSWGCMKQRCLNKKDVQYKDYGNRGITICKEWLEFMPFYEWAMSHGYQENLTIERIDNNGNYEPNNCTWIPKTKQQLNSRQCIPIAINGIKFPTISAAARYFNIKPATAMFRLANGWGIDQAFFAPVRKRSVNA